VPGDCQKEMASIGTEAGGEPGLGRTLVSHLSAVYPDPATSVQDRPHSDGIPIIVGEKRMDEARRRLPMGRSFYFGH
jgi:hypothetical protein